MDYDDEDIFERMIEEMRYYYDAFDIKPREHGLTSGDDMYDLGLCNADFM